MTPPAGAASDDFQPMPHPASLSGAHTAVNFPMPQMPDPTQMNRRATDLQNLTWREFLARVIIEWIRDHGITGILLAVFLYAAYKAIEYAVVTGVPAAIAQIQAGYRERDEQLGKRMDKLESTQEKSVERLTASIDKQAAAMTTLVEEMRRDREFRKRSSP